MKEIKKNCKCDVCMKEVNEEDLIDVTLPFQKVRDKTGSVVDWEPINEYGAMDVEICPECAKEIYGRISSYVKLGDYPYVGKKIEIIREK